LYLKSILLIVANLGLVVFGQQAVQAAARHAAPAEVYAKSLLIGGPQEVERITRQAGDIEFIAVDYQKKLWGSKHSLEILNV